MVTVYGIKNCDTCRAARKWLAEHGIEHRFVDFRADGLSAATVTAWVADVGWETLLNRRSTTWRGLEDGERDSLNEVGAAALMVKHPTLIKRPVVDLGQALLVGFSEATREALKDNMGE